MNPVNSNVVENWLKSERSKNPECRVAAAIGAATSELKLDEGLALKKLRDLYEEPATSPTPNSTATIAPAVPKMR